MLKALFVLGAMTLGVTVPPASREVLVLASASTNMFPDGALNGRKGIELQNRGPNSIYCAVDNAATAGVKNTDAGVYVGRRITPGQTWGIDLSGNQTVYCIAETADQVTGAATIVNQS